MRKISATEREKRIAELSLDIALSLSDSLSIEKIGINVATECSFAFFLEYLKWCDKYRVEIGKDIVEAYFKEYFELDFWLSDEEEIDEAHWPVYIEEIAHLSHEYRCYSARFWADMGTYYTGEELCYAKAQECLQRALEEYAELQRRYGGLEKRIAIIRDYLDDCTDSMRRKKERAEGNHTAQHG